MTGPGVVGRGLALFDRCFVHIFVCSIHLFFIFLSAWLGRFDLTTLGAVMFVLSFAAFEWVRRLGAGNGEGSGKQ